MEHLAAVEQARAARGSEAVATVLMAQLVLVVLAAARAAQMEELPQRTSAVLEVLA
jgi:hypothetical protein